MQIIVAIHKPQHVDPTISHGRQLDDALRLLPGIGNRGGKRKAGFIKILEIDLALGLLVLQGCQGMLTLGKGVWISETLERLSHPFPSKPCLFGQTFACRETEALLGFVGSSLSHPFERTGRCFDILVGEFLFVWAEFAWSATARLLIQTLGAMMFPSLAPGRHGDAMDLLGPRKVLHGRTFGTQQQTMGAAPSSE
jgi:hypothetical protein